MLSVRQLSWLWLAALGIAGCQPKIGDDCSTTIDCSTQGDRLCDTTQPDGYCTIFNCEPDTCPDEAVCVAFNEQLDPACGPLNDSRYGRFGRTFCMRVCDESDDCRSEYECVRPIDRMASVLDTKTDTDDPQDTRICMASAPQVSLPGEIPGVCYPNDGGTELVPYEPDAAAGGSTGGGGYGGTGGTGGTGGSAMGGAGGSGGS